MSEKVVPLTVEAADILPIIKRFVYTEKDIFLRELISNSIDAIEKLRLESPDQAIHPNESEPLRVEIALDTVKRTLTVTDNGIGMDAGEVVRYINQIAFSGAKEFLEKHSDSKNRLVGQFGLGFYSTFMVSERVEIETFSWRLGAGGCRWRCEGGVEAVMEETRTGRRGTSVICHLEDGAQEFLDPERIEAIIYRYLDYAPYPILLAGRQLNMITAPWHLSASEREGLPMQSYMSFYGRLNPSENNPLSWFHIESDFPFELRALLFIPNRADSSGNNIRLFKNRTFITDSCSELHPDWLDFLDGVVESPDIPVNVARDRFQQDRNVASIRSFLTNKTIGFLANLLANRRRDYTAFWEKYGTQIKRGYLESAAEGDTKMMDKLEKLLLFHSSRRPLTTLAEYLERLRGEEKKVFLYSNDQVSHQAHLELLRSRNREAFILDDAFDLLLVHTLDRVHDDWSFNRIDQIEIEPSQQSESQPCEQDVFIWDPLLDQFRAVVGEQVGKVIVEALSSRDIPALLRVTERGAIEDDFQRLMGSEATHKQKKILVINSNSPLIKRLRDLRADIRSGELAVGLVAQIWDNIRLGVESLKEGQLTDAINRHRDFLTLVAHRLGDMNDGEKKN